MTPKGLWMLFMLVFLNTTLQAQTEQETLKFLKTYDSSIPASGYFEVDCRHGMQFRAIGPTPFYLSF